MKKCLDEGTLRAYVDGELPEARMQHANAHLQACADCRDRRERMEATLGRLDLLIGALAPEDLAAIHAGAPRGRWIATALAAAALAASILLFFPVHHAHPRTPATNAKTDAKPRITPPPSVVQSARPRHLPVRHVEPAPNLDDFVPLAGADPIQVGMVVRVTLPVSDASFAGGVREVAADVMIGEDGMARAIRFLE
jgi:hypothetical protein